MIVIEERLGEEDKDETERVMRFNKKRNVHIRRHPRWSPNDVILFH